MEIEFSNFEVDKSIFGEKTISGLYDTQGTFIYNNLYNIEKPKINNNLSVRAYLLLNRLSRKKYILTKKLLNDLELDSKKQKLKLKDLSMTDYIKVVIIRLVSKSCKTIILKNIDISLNYAEQSRLFNTLRRNIKLIDKTIIFESMNIENIVLNSDYYVIIDDKRVVYSGDDFTKIPVKTEIMEIVDLANEKGAKLSYYKDINDLLKAIYRSVKEWNIFYRFHMMDQNLMVFKN